MLAKNNEGVMRSEQLIGLLVCVLRMMLVMGALELLCSVLGRATGKREDVARFELASKSPPELCFILFY